MLQITQGVALVLVLWIGCAGVGLRALRGPSTRPPTSDQTASWGLAACVGLALLIAAGGFASLLRVPVRGFLAAFITAGFVLLARRLLHTNHTLPTKRGVPVWLAVLVAGTVAAIVTQTSIGFATLPNPCDDLLAYVPMSERLLETAQIVEPWSTRRLQNLGAGALVQAYAVGFSDLGAFAIPDTAVAASFLLGIFVTERRRRLGPRLLGITVVVVVALGSVPRANSAAVLLVVPVLLASFICIGEIRGAIERNALDVARRLAIATGLLLAACLGMRMTVAPLALLVCIVGILTTPRAALVLRLRLLGICATVAGTALAPWMLGQWASSGTPLFPVFGGHMNPSVPAARDPDLKSVSQVYERAVHLMTNGPYLMALLVVLLVAVFGRRHLRHYQLLIAVGVSSLVNQMLLALHMTVASDGAFDRYVYPIAMVAVFLLVHMVIGALEESTRTASTKLLQNTTMTLAAVAALFYGARLWELGGVRPSTNSEALKRAESTREVAEQLEPPLLRAEYETALLMLGATGHAIAAVDRPYLIDYSKHDVQSMDFPGWAAPGRRFPLFEGALAKVRVLRDHGYDTLLATTPAHDACFSPQALRLYAEFGPRPSALHSWYWMDWVADVDEILATAPSAVRRTGRLILVDLAQAERQLASPSQV